MLLKNPRPMSRSVLLAFDMPRPPSTRQTGPLWRQVNIGMKVRLVRLIELLETVSVPAPAAPCEHREVLRRILRRVVGRDREAEPLVDRQRVGNIETRMDLAPRLVRGPRRLVEVAIVVAHHDEDAALQLGTCALERAARNHV